MQHLDWESCDLMGVKVRGIADTVHRNRPDLRFCRGNREIKTDRFNQQ